MLKINRQSLNGRDCVFAILENADTFKGEVAFVVTPLEHWKKNTSVDSKEYCEPLIERINSLIGERITHDDGANYSFNGTAEELVDVLSSFGFKQDVQFSQFVNAKAEDQEGITATAQWNGTGFVSVPVQELPAWRFVGYNDLAWNDQMGLYSITRIRHENEDPNDVVIRFTHKIVPDMVYDLLRKDAESVSIDQNDPLQINFPVLHNSSGEQHNLTFKFLCQVNPVTYAIQASNQGA